jgi:hypothetical protein
LGGHVLHVDPVDDGVALALGHRLGELDVGGAADGRLEVFSGENRLKVRGLRGLRRRGSDGEAGADDRRDENKACANHKSSPLY